MQVNNKTENLGNRQSTENNKLTEDNKTKTETIVNSFDFKKQIILLLAVTLFSAIGYIIKTEYFDKKNVVEKYIVDSHEKLYKEGNNIKNLKEKLQ